MALIDLTGVDPYRQINEASARAYQLRNQGLQRVFDGIAAGITAGFQRRAANQEKERMFVDRETSLANQQGNQLTQTESTNKFTNKQLQETGRAFKQEYFDAIQAYENSDKGDEAKQALEDAKAKALGSARTIAQTYENLDAQMEVFRNAAKNGQISTATDPAIRQFMMDLMDPKTPVDQYSIVDDGQGNLKYEGLTSPLFDADGNEIPDSQRQVSFYLEDIANGQNGFTPVAKVDMPTVLSNLAKDIPQAKKEIAREWGVARVNDWDVIGEAMSGRLDQLLKEEGSFRQIAAELGYGFEDFEAAVLEQGYDGLKNSVKEELIQQLAHVTPEVEERVLEYDPQESPAQQTAQLVLQEKALQKQQDINIQVNKWANDPKGSIEELRQSFIGTVPGVDEITYDKKSKKIAFVKDPFGKKQVTQTFDLTNLADKQRLSELLGGNRNLYDKADKRNAALAEQRSNFFANQLNE